MTLLLPCVLESRRMGDSELPWLTRGGRGGVGISELRSSCVDREAGFSSLAIEISLASGLHFGIQKAREWLRDPNSLRCCIQTVQLQAQNLGALKLPLLSLCWPQ